MRAFPGAGARELRFFLRGGWRVSIFFSSARFALQSDYLVSPCARADGRLRSCKLLACVVYVAVATLNDSDVGWMASGGVRRRFSPRSSQSSRYSTMLHPRQTFFNGPVGRSFSPKHGSQARGRGARLVGQPLTNTRVRWEANGQRRGSLPSNRDDAGSMRVATDAAGRLKRLPDE